VQKTNTEIRPLLQKGLNFLQEEKWLEALTPLQKAIEENPNHPIPYFFASLAFLALGENEKGEAMLKQGLEKTPDNALGKNIASLWAFRKNNPAQAMALLEEAGIVENPLVQAFLLLELERLP
jgi:Tfp pilus assembly protein PilF